MPASDAPSPDHRGRRILALVLTGAVGGVFSGAFGVGGGVIMVPLLLWLVKLDHRRAAATSLAAIIPSAIVGSIAYYAAGHIDVVAALLVAAGGIAGSLIGTRLLRTLPIGILRWGFIVILLIVAVRMLFEVPSRGADIEFTAVSVVGLVVLGLVMGIAAGLFGIGGGVLVVPVLIALFGAGDLVAKGTSLLAIVPTSLAGTVANFRAGLVRPLDGLVIGLTAAAASFLGTAIAFAMPPRLSAILFGILVALVAAQLAVRAIRAGRNGEATDD